MHTGLLQSCPALCGPMNCGLSSFSVRDMGGYLGKNIRVCCHILLEHYISCCPSCELPLSTCATRAPANQAAVPPSHLGLTGADPSSPEQPQVKTLVDNLHAEVEIKPQLKPMGSVPKEEDVKPSHQLYKLQIKTTWSTRQTVSMEYIKGHWELPQKKMH